ncbi:MAG: hypothetical protein U0736_19360 [Gemmataceae bacterium]
MSVFLPEGPLGFPMPDAMARAVDALLRSLPRSDEHAYRHILTPQPPTELNPGEPLRRVDQHRKRRPAR